MESAFKMVLNKVPMLLMVIGVFVLVGCAGKQSVYQIGLENKVEKHAVSYDSRTVEYEETKTPVSWIKHVEYKTSGGVSPQIKQVLAFYCVRDVEDTEECQMISQPYAASGSGLVNDVLEGVGAATVGAAGFVGGLYLLRPDTTNTTNTTTQDVQQDGGEIHNTTVNTLKNSSEQIQQQKTQAVNRNSNTNSNDNSNVNRNRGIWKPKR